MKPALVILAAGIGSRYGGLKQLDPLGPSGESLLDYSVFDAVRAGFGKAVFVVRDEIQRDFERRVLPRFQGHIESETVVQRLEDLPNSFGLPPGRKKPWGTGHALLAAAPRLKGPFAVLNADDFYGGESLELMGRFLSEALPELAAAAMVGFRLADTLSPHGSTSRGLCQVDENGDLSSIREELVIEATSTGARRQDPNGTWHPLTGDEIVSMNCWGFTSPCLAMLEESFVRGLSEVENRETWEFYIPLFVQNLIDAGAARVRVIPTKSKWVGITYPEDRNLVCERLAGLVAQGLYPNDLWS